MKTSRLKFVQACILFSYSLLAEAQPKTSDRFGCLRDLLPISEHASLIRKRKGFEAPFIINGGSYVAFPEVIKGRVSGFFFYDATGAWYYDAVEKGSSKIAISDLQGLESGILVLVAQPKGLETVAVRFLPGFSDKTSPRGGPVVLGASILPVVGAFVSRPDLKATAYYDPEKASEEGLKTWISDRRGVRAPAGSRVAGESLKIERTILPLAVHRAKKEDELWRPLDEELRLRLEWLRSRNLDQRSFKEFVRLMEKSCRQ